MLFKTITVQPLTSERWTDFEKLFGDKGACGGCWCMYWKLKRSDFVKGKGSGNKKKIKKIVGSGEIPGLLLYADKEAAGWCAIAPRAQYPLLVNSKILRPVDEKPVWSIVCFFIDKNFRRLGLTEIFLRYVVEYGKKQGAKIVEGYPVDVKDQQDYPAAFAFTGIASAYIKAGFREVARRSETRPVMRYYI